MKLRNYVFCIANGPDHDRLLDQLLDRADRLGLQASRSAIGTGLASGTAILYHAVVLEPGEVNPMIQRVNWNLEYLRASFEPMTVKVVPN